MKQCGIYLLTHIETGRLYVGQSIDIDKRWYMHSRGLGETKIARAIRKHGWAAFKAEVLCICEPSLLNSLEETWIRHHNCVSPLGYNLTSGGGQFSFSEETLEVLRQRQRNRTPEHIDNKNKAAKSEETRLKLSAALKGRVKTLETRQKLSVAFKGRVMSDETRAAMSAAAKRRSQDPAFIERISQLNKGKPLTAEHRAKISSGNKTAWTDERRAAKALSQTGRKHTEETLAKMRGRRSTRTPQMEAPASSLPSPEH